MMKTGVVRRLMYTSLAAVSFSALSLTYATAASSFGMVIGKSLADLCTSDSEIERGMCMGYVEAILAIQHKEVSSAEIQCFGSDLLALRNAALHGWGEIQELLKWADGQIVTGNISATTDKQAVENARKLVSDVENRKKLLADVHSGALSREYRACLSRHR